MVNEQLSEIKNNSSLDFIPESKSKMFYKEPISDNTFLQNRRVLKYINYDNDKYKEKANNIDSPNRETIFRRTNFVIR